MIIVIYYAKYRKLLLRKNLNYFIKPKRKFPIYKDNSPEQLKLKNRFGKNILSRNPSNH